MPPDVSVIIPTRNRPALLARALRSVLCQTFVNFDVIVVVDGPDDSTVAMLEEQTDARVRYIVNPRSLTAAGARNKGVEQAAGRWVAFLDDDDEWLPFKLERQLEAAGSCDDMLVTCRSTMITPTASYVWPSVAYNGAMPLDEYLFDRQTAFSGAAFIQTSSYLLPRRAALAWPFRTDTPHDDWDFILRLAKHAGVRIMTVPDVLVNLYVEERRPSLSNAGSWAVSLEWLNRSRDLFTPRGYSGFCLGVVGPRAASERAYAAFVPLLAYAFRFGAPRPLHVMAYVSFWAMSQNLRRRLRAALSSRRVAGNSAGSAIGVGAGPPDDTPRHA